LFYSCQPGRIVLSSAEDLIHRGLALLLGATAGALFLVRGPGTVPPPEAASAEVDTGPALYVEVNSTIQDLAARLGRSVARTPLDVNLRLLALGRAALEESPKSSRPPSATSNLDTLLGAPPAQPAGLPSAAPDSDAADASGLATLSILLEAGTPLELELPLSTGPTPLGHLLEVGVTRLGAHPGVDALSIDLLSFAVLAGMKDHRDELGRLVRQALTRLEQQHHALVTAQGATPPGLAEPRDAPPPSDPDKLRLSASLFRATAVLGDPALRQRALRHLSTLLYRYQADREAYRSSLERTSDQRAKVEIHLRALESLGRLEEALFGAHIAFRNGDRPGPAPRTAASMKRVARDLLEHYAAVRATLPADTDLPTPVLRALTHALRGLRAARVAT